MHYKKIGIIITCAMLSAVVPVSAEEGEVITETVVREEQTTEETTEETAEKTTEKETEKKEQKKEQKKDQKKEQEKEKPIDPIRDRLSTGGDNVALTSKNRAKYNMPKERIHGLTDPAKARIKPLKKKIKKLKKQIQNNAVEITRLKKVQQMAFALEKQLVITPDSFGQNSSIGTIRTIASIKRMPNTYDARLLELSHQFYDADLTKWIQRYTLDYCVSVTSHADFSQGDTSDVLPVLTAYQEKIDHMIAALEKGNETSKNSIAEIREQISQCGVERIFDPNDVTIPSNLTTKEVKTMLRGTNLEKLSKTFVECEKEYQVNAVFLMSIAAHESDWGNSRRAREDHNYTGYGVSSDSAKGINADCGEDNIRHTAMKLHTNYLSKDGKYYKGVRVCDVHKTYCATGGWSEGVCAAAYTVMERILSEPQYDCPKKK